MDYAFCEFSNESVSGSDILVLKCIGLDENMLKKRLEIKKWVSKVNARH